MKNTRQMEKEDKIIAKEIKKEMGKIEDIPPPYAWEKISSQLTLAGSVSKSKKEPLPWYRSLAFAASVLFLVGIGSSVFFSQFLEQEDALSTYPGAMEMMRLEERGLSEPPDSVEPPDEITKDAETGIMGFEDELGAATAEDEPDSIQERPPVDSNVSGIPDIVNDFVLVDIREAEDEVRASHFLYTSGSQDIWLVVSEDNPGAFIDYPGPEGLFIPGKSDEALYDNTSRVIIRDNNGNNALAWFFRGKYYIIWPRTDGISGRDIMDFRSNWPTEY